MFPLTIKSFSILAFPKTLRLLPVTDTAPFNEDVYEFKLEVDVLTDSVNVFIIEPVAITDAENELTLEVNVLINEPVAITLALNVFND
jgi:hypothetical protein